MRNMFEPCFSICRDRNRIPPQADALDRAGIQIRRITKDAGREDTRECDKVLSRSPYLLQMCDCYIRCRYGMNYPGCRYLGYRQELRRRGEETAKGIVLAGIVDPERTKALLPFFSGHFPKAARYIAEIRKETEEKWK